MARCTPSPNGSFAPRATSRGGPNRRVHWSWRRGKKCLRGTVFVLACWWWRWDRERWTGPRSASVSTPDSKDAIHARLPAALAELQSGWELFLEFALEVGAIGRAEQQELEERSQRAFAQLCALQATYQQARNPALRFAALLPRHRERNRPAPSARAARLPRSWTCSSGRAARPPRN